MNEAVALLRGLVRFDTTNPPGDERACITYLNNVLRAGGLETLVVARSPRRPNLVARLPGRGEAPPILFYGHVDVVGSAASPHETEHTCMESPFSSASPRQLTWTHSPFSAALVDGEIWGRGTLDDKVGVAMMAMALLRARADGYRPPGDVILAALADEEVQGVYGAGYLVNEHAALFEGVHYALGEGGGYSVTLAGRRLYPIMVAEKQACRLRVTTQGAAGHGSTPQPGQAMGKLGAALTCLDRRRLPVHVTPPVAWMLRELARALPFPGGWLLGRLRDPWLPAWLTDRLLNLVGPVGTRLAPLFHNTASPTMVEGGYAHNVIPAEARLTLDGRALPGYTGEDVLREVQGLLRDIDGVAVELLHYEPGPPPADPAPYRGLAALLREADPEATPFPYVLSGTTDARHFARLGIQTYGFVPLALPEAGPGDDGPGDYLETIHGINERVPVASYLAGIEVLGAVVRRWSVWQA